MVTSAVLLASGIKSVQTSAVGVALVDQTGWGTQLPAPIVPVHDVTLRHPARSGEDHSTVVSSGGWQGAGGATYTATQRDSYGVFSGGHREHYRRQRLRVAVKSLEPQLRWRQPTITATTDSLRISASLVRFGPGSAG